MVDRSLKKIKGILPLPGGARNYGKTLKKILEKIDSESPTVQDFVSWLKMQYELSGKHAPHAYCTFIKNRLGFLKEEDGRLKLTTTAEGFIRTGNSKVVLDTLKERFLGFDEIASMLSEDKRLSLSEIHRGLLEKCGVDWKSTNQVIFRLNWLVSLGSVDKDHEKYYLTGR